MFKHTKTYIRKLFAPVTIVLIPHNDGSAAHFRVPSIVLVAAVLLWGAISFKAIAASVSTERFEKMESELHRYATTFQSLKDTINRLSKAESEFRTILPPGTTKEEAIKSADLGSDVDITKIREAAMKQIENVESIKQYLREERNIFLATPTGWPVDGRISSQFGWRVHPIYGAKSLHRGVDISESNGKKVRATADGVVTYSGWEDGSGYVVAVEHGRGYTTFYAHNRKNLVNVGDRVSRGDVLGIVGSTGTTTGPHLHYEVWKDGAPTDPVSFITASAGTASAAQ